MANVDYSFGLELIGPIQDPKNDIFVMSIPATDSVQVNVGDPVKLGSAAGQVARCAAGNAIWGTVLGFSSATNPGEHPAYRPASTLMSAIVLRARAGQKYRIQDAAAATDFVTSKYYDITITDGATTNPYNSACELDASTANASTGQLRAWEVETKDPLNTAGTNQNLIVTINEIATD